jgi:hypothetical protein
VNYGNSCQAQCKIDSGDAKGTITKGKCSDTCPDKEDKASCLDLKGCAWISGFAGFSCVTVAAADLEEGDVCIGKGVQRKDDCPTDTTCRKKSSADSTAYCLADDKATTTAAATTAAVALEEGDVCMSKTVQRPNDCPDTTECKKPTAPNQGPATCVVTDEAEAEDLEVGDICQNLKIKRKDDCPADTTCKAKSDGERVLYCIADKASTTTAVATTTAAQCTCTGVLAPVCLSGVNYGNSCQAQCKIDSGEVKGTITKGKCQTGGDGTCPDLKDKATCLKTKGCGWIMRRVGSVCVTQETTTVAATTAATTPAATTAVATTTAATTAATTTSTEAPLKLGDVCLARNIRRQDDCPAGSECTGQHVSFSVCTAVDKTTPLPIGSTTAAPTMVTIVTVAPPYTLPASTEANEASTEGTDASTKANVASTKGTDASTEANVASTKGSDASTEANVASTKGTDASTVSETGSSTVTTAPADGKQDASKGSNKAKQHGSTGGVIAALVVVVLVVVVVAAVGFLYTRKHATTSGQSKAPQAFENPTYDATPATTLQYAHVGINDVASNC